MKCSMRLYISLLLIISFNLIFSTKATERCSHFSYKAFSGNTCEQVEFCRKVHNISYINIRPYAPSKGVQSFLRICCQNCTKFSIVHHFSNVSEVNPISLNTSHFVYPFIGSVNDKFVNGYYFIPVLHVPRAYYLTIRSDVTLFHSLLRLFPLGCICLLMAAVAGFVCWIAETRSNSKEFPKSFIQGWFQGFWWSVASMTTVGYGDKTPKSLFGRLFGIVWIFTGITICGILTAMLTTTTLDANNPKVPTMNGAKVGILKYRKYDSLLVAHHGGIFYEAESADMESSVYELVQKLHSSENIIDGLLFDTYTLWYILGNITNMYYSPFGTGNRSSIGLEQKQYITEALKQMVLSSVEYTQEVLSYGILARYEADYDFLSDVIRSNRFQLHEYLHDKWNKERRRLFRRQNVGLFDVSQPYFRMALFALTAGMALICLTGVLYEISRRGDSKMQKKVEQIRMYPPRRKFAVYNLVPDPDYSSENENTHET